MKGLFILCENTEKVYIHKQELETPLLQKMGEGEHYRDAGTGSPSTVAELKARINWIRIQGLEQTAGSRVWTRGPAMSLCPGITAPQSLGTSRTYMIPNTAWWVSSPADRPEQPWLLLREHSVFPVNTRSSGNTVPTSAVADMPVQCSTGEPGPRDVSCSAATARTSRNARCLRRAPGAFPTCFLAHVMQRWTGSWQHLMQRTGAAPGPSMEIQPWLSCSTTIWFGGCASRRGQEPRGSVLHGNLLQL